MSVKVVRMQNGEDVVADVKEIRPEEGKSAIAYEFLDAMAVQILRSTEDMFEETGEAEASLVRLFRKCDFPDIGSYILHTIFMFIHKFLSRTTSSFFYSFLICIN